MGHHLHDHHFDHHGYSHSHHPPASYNRVFMISVALNSVSGPLKRYTASCHLITPTGHPGDNFLVQVQQELHAPTLNHATN